MALTRKIYNVTVKFNNPKLIELALLGKLYPDDTPYEQVDLVGCNLKLLNQLIREYKDIYKTLVYPMNDLELPTKYAHIALQLIKDNTDLTKDMIDTRNGLLIQIGKDRFVHFVKQFWYVVKTDQFKPCIITSPDKLGHKEYEWLMFAYDKKVPSQKFYAQFMPDLVKACRGNILAIQHILQNFYTNQSGVSLCTAPRGSIIDLDTRQIYQLIMYPTHKFKLPNDEMVVQFVHNKPQLQKGYDTFTAYDYYINSCSETHLTSKKCGPLVNLAYEDAIYKVVTFISLMFNGSLTNAQYRLFRLGNLIILELNNNIYTVTTGDMQQPQLLVGSARVINVKNGIIYFTTSESVSNYQKQTDYAYSISQGKLEPCAITYNLKI